MAQGRRHVRQIFINLINSLKPKKLWGVVVGKDHLGTTYYEIPEEREVGSIRRRSRWYVPPKGAEIDHKIPAEWMAWLRNTRKSPPTEEEIQLNMAKMRVAIEGAKKLEAISKESSPKTDQEIKTFEKVPFPVYEDYQTDPRNGSDKKGG